MIICDFGRFCRNEICFKIFLTSESQKDRFMICYSSNTSFVVPFLMRYSDNVSLIEA